MKKYGFWLLVPLVIVLILNFGCQTSETVTGDGDGTDIDSLLREAYQAMVNEDYAGASSIYSQVLQLDSDNSEAMFGKATCMIFLLERFY